MYGTWCHTINMTVTRTPELDTGTATDPTRNREQQCAWHARRSAAQGDRAYRFRRDPIGAS